MVEELTLFAEGRVFLMECRVIAAIVSKLLTMLRPRCEFLLACVEFLVSEFSISRKRVFHLLLSNIYNYILLHTLYRDTKCRT